MCERRHYRIGYVAFTPWRATEPLEIIDEIYYWGRGEGRDSCLSPNEKCRMQKSLYYVTQSEFTQQ